MANKMTSGGSKRSSKKTAQLVPAARYLRYDMVGGSAGVETSHYVDLARDLSRINRRGYKQGKDYFVKKVTVISSNTPNLGNRISVSTCPDTWVSRGAWKRGLGTWNEMNKIGTDQVSGNITGTWADFKVHLSFESRSAGNENPIDNGGAPYLPGSWDYSELITPDGTLTDDEFELTMMGDHNGAAGVRVTVGLIKSYGESRATVQPTDPNVPDIASDDPLVNVFDYGTTIDDVIDNLVANNDEPPYDVNDYPGGDLNGSKPLVIQDTTLVDGRATLSGFNALFGLLEFEMTSSLPSDVFSVLIELAPGKYRGIKAESI